MDKKEAIPSTFNGMYWLHLLLAILNVLGSFLFSWYLMLAAYATVLMQFQVFGRCLMNKEHGLNDDNENYTFYAHLLEKLGFNFDRRKVRVFVRGWMYLVLATITIVWQLGLGFKPLLFFR